MLGIRHSISTYVFSFVDGEIRFLTLRRSPSLRLGGTWQAVHGRIEEGEKTFEAAARETSEETGLWPERFFRLEYIEQFYDHETDAIHLIPAFAAFVEGLPAVSVSEEHTACGWCSLEETLGRFIWPSQKEAVRLIAEGTAGWPETNEQLFELTAFLQKPRAARAR